MGRVPWALAHGPWALFHLFLFAFPQNPWGPRKKIPQTEVERPPARGIFFVQGVFLFQGPGAPGGFMEKLVKTLI